MMLLDIRTSVRFDRPPPAPISPKPPVANDRCWADNVKRMDARPYSDKTKAYQVLMDLIGHISRRGWFSAGPSTSGEDSLYFASFHVPVEDADRIYGLFTKSLEAYPGGTKWVCRRSETNRFLLCPVQLSEMAESLGGFNEALQEVSRSAPELGRAAAKDLVRLCDFIYSKGRAEDIRSKQLP